MTSDQPPCQALRLSDGGKCKDVATNVNGLFCRLHAKQAFGLYKGYKSRNARLDAIDDEAPAYLKSSKTPLANETFAAIEDEHVLREVHSHLFDKYVLLCKVIDARKLHHQYFYPLKVDYGHQAYLDKLSSQRHTVLQALGALEKRTAQVLYHKEQWYAWVREVQEEEEANREKEQKKIKQEAALFKRHMKNLQARLERMRENEEKLRQDAYLDNAYQKCMVADETDVDEAWDPIEDVENDKRYRYIDLIKHFLWMEVLDDGENQASSSGSNTKPADAGVDGESQPPATKAKKRSKAKGAASKSSAGRNSLGAKVVASKGQSRLLAMQESGEGYDPAELGELDKSAIETEAEMRKRLIEGVQKNYDEVWGFRIVGTLENPHETHEKTAPMTKDEVESVVTDIREIKRLLFSRLILAQASLLPAALRASSVEEFLNDADVAESDLRDLCLKVAEPALQVTRDACADFARRDTVEEENDDVTDDEVDESEEDDDDETWEELLTENRRYSKLHSGDWLVRKYLLKSGLLPPKERKTRLRRTKVTICGKTIWNHASEKAMSRDGWLQFSVMAKDCSLENAIQLCRNWAEFSDLNLLTVWEFFPASNWVSWGGNRLIQQLQELSFFPYFLDFGAQHHTRHHQVGGRSQLRRQHDIVETRNIIVGHMKRNDPVTRRFLQYLLMRAGEVLVLVRDGKTGRVITAPPEEHLWTYRKKQGIGRASKNEYVNVLEVGPEYFDMLDLLRKWRFSFNDYYDVYIWDFVPGQSSMDTYNVIIHELRNAWRITHPRGVYAHMEPLLRTLTREDDTMRTRQIKAGEDVKTLWHKLMDERNQFVLFNIDGKKVTSYNASEDRSSSPYLFYNAANVAEDRVLFPDDLASNKQDTPFREMKNGVNRIESGVLPSAVKHVLKNMAKMELEDNGPQTGPNALNNDKDALWGMPNVWESGMKLLKCQKHSAERRRLLNRTGIDAKHLGTSFEERFGERETLETMERDRSAEFKESIHEGDVEPGSKEKYYEVQGMIDAMLRCEHTGSTDWIWFLADIMDWLQVRADDDDYSPDPMAPWPHSFIVQDIVRVFVTMAMFFPGLEVTELVTNFMQSTPFEAFKKSPLFDPKQRKESRPDRRERTSYKYRSKQFWAKWDEFFKISPNFVDKYPFDWSLAIRPIVAQLYRAGVIAPLHAQNDMQIVSGIATANTEPHRPDKLDLFINYHDHYGHFPITYPPSFIPPSQFPALLPLAQKFAKTKPHARFALVRLWSAPHFYPLMVGLQNRLLTSFLDSVGRSWQWKFVPKDMPGSEFSIHNTVGRRLDLFREQFGDRVAHRADLILVMAEDVEELLRMCTAVTFVMQTKPWLREVDLWKSFIDVDLEFLQNLDDFWLD